MEKLTALEKARDKLERLADMEHPMSTHAIPFMRSEAQAIIRHLESIEGQNAALLAALKVLIKAVEPFWENSRAVQRGWSMTIYTSYCKALGNALRQADAAIAAAARGDEVQDGK